MTPEVTKNVLNTIILNVWIGMSRLDLFWWVKREVRYLLLTQGKGVGGPTQSG
jgi:hypothetical protein